MKDASVLLTLLLMRQNNKVERLICLLSRHVLKQSHRRSSFRGSSPQSLLRPLIQDILLRQRRKTVFPVITERYGAVMQSPMSLFCNSRGRVLLLQRKLQNKRIHRKLHRMERARFVTQAIDFPRRTVAMLHNFQDSIYCSFVL